MTDQLIVGQLQQKVEELKTEYDLQRNIKDNAINAKIQRSRDKICEILRRVQGRRPKTQMIESEQSEINEEEVQKQQAYVSKYNEEVLQRRHYIFQFKMYLRRKRERLQREQEFKLLKLLDQQTSALQKWVTKESNDFEMFDFFYSQIDIKRKGQVHQILIKNFMFENPLIMSLFQFDRDSLQLALDSFQVKEKFHLTKEEFMLFLQKYQKVKPQKGFKQFIHLFDPTYQTVDLRNNEPRVLLLQNIDQLQQAFYKASENGTASIDQIIKSVREDCQLFEDAVHIINIGLNLMLENVLQLIEIEYIDQPDTQLSWNQFLLFFDNLPDIQQQQEEIQVQQEVQEDNISQQSSDDYFYDMAVKFKSQDIELPQQKKQKPIKSRKPLQEINIDKKVFTVPKKVGYEKRQQTTSIREKWLMEQIRQKQEEIEEAYKFKPFKATPIPAKVRDKNYYQHLQELEEIRRRELKQRCQERTLQISKPFSFDGRKKEEPIPIEEPSTYKFRANPIPWYCSLKLYERNIIEQKRKSENQKKIRKFWWEQNSKLPPRMEEWLRKQQILQQEKEAAAQSQRLQTKQARPRARSIPDFVKLQAQFQEQLNSKRKQFTSTIPIGPQFSQTKTKVIYDFLDQQIPQHKIDPIKRAKNALSKQPILTPQSTQKFDAYVQHIQEKKWEDITLQQQEFFEQQQREEKKSLFLPRVQQSWAIADHRQQQIERQQQKFIEAYQKRKQEEEDFNQMMKDIFVRVYQRPLLMEMESMQQEQEPVEEQQQYDYMNPIGEQDVEESERLEQEDQEEDPEGVDQVGEQAEHSNKECDGQEIEDGQYGDEIDMDNIDPQLLDQMQRDALANQYGLTQEQIEQLQRMGDSDYEDNQDFSGSPGYIEQRRNSF